MNEISNKNAVGTYVLKLELIVRLSEHFINALESILLNLKINLVVK